ncbi:hypothetical protein Ocin01_14649 [Orchesella cincta]|uniref:Uncharacterized protein n=1 Tax=Orchesella cincta TaxID=48709 RepID=A0A1D2MGD4_ORCCI|nr:hypothetical protein Ocin01_14649 [Orchesella cincta]
MDTINEQDGIAEMRHLINDFLSSKQGSSKVREYISSVAQDDNRLRIYLNGRKYRANYAWDTLKRYAEVRFDEYPEHFLDESHDVGFKNCGNSEHAKIRDKLDDELLS